MPDPNPTMLPDWVTDALHEPVPSTPAARARIMDAVRSSARPRRVAAPIRPSRWLRRGLLSPVGGLITTAVMTLALLLRIGPRDGLLHRSVSEIQTAAMVLGDSVVPTSTPRMADTLATAARLLDTLRIVEFVIRGSSVHAASVLGDFNGWKRGATPMISAGRDEWRARVLVPHDVLASSLNVAYLVNQSRVIPAAETTPLKRLSN